MHNKRYFNDQLIKASEKALYEMVVHTPVDVTVAAAETHIRGRKMQVQIVITSDPEDFVEEDAFRSSVRLKFE